MNKLEQMLKTYDDPLDVTEYSDAEDLIHELRVELAGKEAVIKMMEDDNRARRENRPL